MEQTITIYHNARCGKSRDALQLLQERGAPHKVRLYLTEPLGRKELAALLRKLRMQPSQIVRRNEAVYKEEYAGRELDEDQWLDALVLHPILIERPIVAAGRKAIVARPPERVLELL